MFERVESVSERLAVLQDERLMMGLAEEARENFMATLSHLASACIGGKRTHSKPPRCVDRPLQVIARSVGRPARLDFTEIVLCNWAVTHMATNGNNGSQADGQLVEQSASEEQQRRR